MAPSRSTVSSSSTARAAKGQREGLARSRAGTAWSALRDRWPEVWPWAPAALAAAYALVVLANFSSLITAINMDSDVSIALMIGKLVGSAPHASQVVLGNHPWYEPLWFLDLTSGFPGYRQLWEIAPAAWSLVGLAVLTWSAWWALGRRAAILTASALLCVGTAGRMMFFSFDWHGPTVVHTVFLGAVVVWLAGRAQPLRLREMSAVALGMGAISALPAAGDSLFLYWAILPLLFTCALLVWRTRSPVHWQALAVAVEVAVVALAGGAVLHHAMVRDGWTSLPFRPNFASTSVLGHNFVLLAQAYTNLAGGNFFGTRVNFANSVTFASGLLFLGALVCVPFELYRRVRRSVPAPVSLDPVAARRVAYIAFWATSLAITTAAFVFSSVPVDANSARFLLAGYVGVGALLPLLATRGRGWSVIVTSAVCLFAVIASFQVIRNPFQPQLNFPTPQRAQALARFAKAEGVTDGYAGYWDAADLTWMSRFGVRVYPVSQCTPQHLVICPYNIGISSWYTPRRGARSMLIVDHGIQLPLVNAPDPKDGAPTATTTIGDLTVYVYPFDIASNFNRIY